MPPPSFEDPVQHSSRLDGGRPLGLVFNTIDEGPIDRLAVRGHGCVLAHEPQRLWAMLRDAAGPSFISFSST
jgi:hypothetical protein